MVQRVFRAVSAVSIFSLVSFAAIAEDPARDVKILRDTWGVPHIFGKTDADTAFGLAYAHCEDDFTTIQSAFIAGRSLGGVNGGPDVLHAVYGKPDEATGQLIGQAGDTLILMVNWDKAGKVHSQVINQFGAATSVESSPHYNDQSPLFVARKLRPVWMDEPAIRANLEREYRPGEE